MLRSLLATVLVLGFATSANAQSEWAIFTDGNPASIAEATADVIARGGVVGPTSGNFGTSSVWILSSVAPTYRVGCALHSVAGPVIAFSGGIILTITPPGLPTYQQMIPIFSGANSSNLSWESVLLFAPPGSVITATFTGVGMTATYKMFVVASIDITVIGM